MNDVAIQHLSTVDPILRDLIALVGPCGLEPDHARSPFQALVQAVAHQQLNGKAASTILSRLSQRELTFTATALPCARPSLTEPCCRPALKRSALPGASRLDYVLALT